jgi:DNA-binding transcriptional MerR regulator
MLATRTYSITELGELSGFDRRTIVYYIHQGLIPKAGRRGPHTRYPEECLLRLRFIRGLKDLQDQGRCGTITLLQIRGLLDSLDQAALRALLERGLPPAEIELLLATPPTTAPSPPWAPVGAPPASPAPQTTGDRRSYGLADAGVRQRHGAPPAPQPPHPGPATPPAAEQLAHEDTEPRLPALTPPAPAETPADIQSNLGELLRELEVRPALTGRRLPPGASEQWTEIPITSRVFLSVRGLSENDAPLADAAARALRKLLRAR